MDDITLIDSGNKHWQAFLLSENIRADVYHTPEYCRIWADYEGGRACAFTGSLGAQRFLIPLIVCPLDSGQELADAHSPYGYGSPLLEDGPYTMDALLELLLREAGAENLVSVFLRHHPLIGDLSSSGASEYLERLGPSFSMDVRSTDWRTSIRQRHRRSIKRLQKLPLSIRLNDLSVLDKFAELYRATMKRLGSAGFYQFPDELFGALFKGLSAHFNLLTLHNECGELVCGVVYSIYGEFGQYHFSATHPTFVPLSPSKLLILSMFENCEAQGVSFVNLGGGVGARIDSLAFFKQGFSNNRRPFYVSKLITSSAKYRDLCSSNGGRELTAIEGKFFPAYRAR